MVGDRGFKPADVEEPIDRWWHRPLAHRLVVRPVRASPVSPDQLTLASGAASLLCAAALVLAGAFDRRLSLAAAALLLASILLDCADGQLARLRGTTSALGRWLDGAVDAVTVACVLGGAAAMETLSGGEGWLWALAAVTAASLAWHTSVYDAAKSLYLAGAGAGAGDDPIPSPTSLSDERRRRTARGQRAAALLTIVGILWTRAMAPWTRPWRRRLPRCERERGSFVRTFRPLVRAAAWLGLGTHLFVLTVAMALSASHPGAHPIAWLLIAGPMNLLCLGVTIAWRRRARRYLLGRGDPFGRSFR